MALHFRGTSFYQYHILFANQAAARLHQFNQGTYWGSLDSELYCHVFAARASLSCNICGAPSHPATACTSVISLRPRQLACTSSVSDRLSTAAPARPLLLFQNPEIPRLQSIAQHLRVSTNGATPFCTKEAAWSVITLMILAAPCPTAECSMPAPSVAALMLGIPALTILPPQQID